jgi:hypothetical protein
MEKERGKNNAQSLFGIHLIPSANQLRNLLDPVPAETISPIYREIFRGLQQSGKINEFHVLDKTVLVAIEGLEFFSSLTIHCNNGKGADSSIWHRILLKYTITATCVVQVFKCLLDLSNKI